MGGGAATDGAEIPRRSVSTIGLAALQISERCAHPFPTHGPAPRPTHTRPFSLRRQIGRSRKMGAAEDGRAGSLRTALGWPLRATGGARRPADRLWRPNEGYRGDSLEYAPNRGGGVSRICAESPNYQTREFALKRNGVARARLPEEMFAPQGASQPCQAGF